LLAFIEHLLEWSRNHPIYIVTLARPELFDRRADWGAGWRGVTSVTLEPLTDEAMRELLDGLVPGLPEPALARILERAEGVPLYAVETVRMLLAEGRLEPTDGAYRPTGDLTELAVPESLHALVAARLDALEGPMRTLVQEASVLGKTFSVGALAAMNGADPGELERSLRDLVRRELFTVDADPRSPERGQYGFVQAVIREVAYGTLARRERRRLHLAAARYFESLEDDEISGALAGHYLDAYRARPEGPEGAAVATQARLALKAAAERATRLRSSDLALHYLEQAVEVARDDADRADLYVLAGRAALGANKPRAAQDQLRRAEELYRELGDRPGQLTAIAEIGIARTVVLDVEAALQPLLDTAAEFADLDQTAAYASLAESIARVEMRLSHVTEALAWCDRGLPLAERHGDVRLALEFLITRATVLGSAGRVTEAEAVMRGARDIAAEHGYVDAEARACVNLGFVLPDPAKAFSASQDGLALVFRMGMPSYLNFLIANLSESGIPLGRWDDVEAMLGPALELKMDAMLMGQINAALAQLEGYRGEDYQAHLDAVIANVPPGDPQARASVAQFLAEMALAQGDYPQADAQASRALAEFREAVSPMAEATVGRASLWGGKVDGARRVLDDFGNQRLATAGPLRRELGAGIAALEGRADDAAEEFSHALRAYAELGLVFERALCQLTMAATLPAGRSDVVAAVADARAILGRLRAAPFLARLDELLARAPAAVGAPAGHVVTPTEGATA
jgi:tetratricopeptide (TPR) repeat protein